MLNTWLIIIHTWTTTVWCVGHWAAPLEQLELRAWLKGTSVVVMREQQALLFHFPLPDSFSWPYTCCPCYTTLDKHDEVRGSLNQWQFIVRGSWMSEPKVMTIYSTAAEIVHSKLTDVNLMSVTEIKKAKGFLSHYNSSCGDHECLKFGAKPSRRCWDISAQSSSSKSCQS